MHWIRRCGSMKPLRTPAFCPTCIWSPGWMAVDLPGSPKEVCAFERPFDVQFRDMMVRTTKALLSCGFRIVYAFTESDEISLLFDREEHLFGRKLRKLNSLLAGEASAQFSLQLGQVATFDCRISQLPNQERVIDYFCWRSADAARNALNAHCYWCLRKEGRDARQATQELSGLTFGQKNELLSSGASTSTIYPSGRNRESRSTGKSLTNRPSIPSPGKRLSRSAAGSSSTISFPVKQTMPHSYNA